MYLMTICFDLASCVWAVVVITVPLTLISFLVLGGPVPLAGYFLRHTAMDISLLNSFFSV